MFGGGRDTENRIPVGRNPVKDERVETILLLPMP